MVLSLNTAFKYVAVIALGFLVFILDYLELANPVFNETLLFVISAGKSAYFIWFTFDEIRESSKRDFFFHEFVPFVSLTVVLVVLSFGLDFYGLYRIRPGAFAGKLEITDNVDTLITFLYFSLTNFTTAGLGEIVPNATIARIFVMLELFIAYFFTILVIANITHIRESISKKDKASD